MPDESSKTPEIIQALIRSYNDEMETVMNYIAASENLDGVLAMEVRESLEEEIQEELGHAQRLANRVRTLGGTVPGSLSLSWRQESMQPTKESTDVVAVIRGVIEAEKTAIDGYKKIIDMTDGVDWATQDLAIELLADEQKHLREFEGFLKGYRAEGKA